MEWTLLFGLSLSRVRDPEGPVRSSVVVSEASRSHDHGGRGRSYAVDEERWIN